MSPIAASPAHAAVMGALHALAFPPDERWDAGAFAMQLGLPGVFGLILPDAGFVLARVAADEAEILTIGIVPAMRGNGHGAMLLRAAEGQAAAAGAQKMFLEVSFKNLAARAMYRAAGYETVGRRARYYPDGSDALMLGKRLSPAAATD
jgi:ribosomal-protein-alanine N-acetyltransferase